MSDRGWSEESSQYFLDYAAYFVPDRAAQLEAICQSIPASPKTFHVAAGKQSDGSWNLLNY